MNDLIPIKRALISVSDKTRVLELARALAARQVVILSTGGTAKLLMENGVAVTEVADYTGFPEMMEGRVKTLHPKIHGGLLGRRGQDDAVMAAHGMAPLDLLVVNLYPFERTVAHPGCTLDHAIENIDIGGPAMLRAAAKNFAAVTVLVDPYDYDSVLHELKHHGATTRATRFHLALKAYEHTARYDGAIANYLGSLQENGERSVFPRTYSAQFKKIQDLRYGENPHQRAAFYVDQLPHEAGIATARQLQGKELSFNNIADADAALECAKSFSEAPACVIVKHANPCGVAVAPALREAYELAYRTDPTSAFGGIIAFNRPLDAATAQAIIERQFVEVIIAPAVAEDACALLATKPNIRVLECGAWQAERRLQAFDYQRVNGGLLIQDTDVGQIAARDLKVVTQRAPNDQERRDLLFAWRVAKFVKSNAIVYARDDATVGIGAGQMSRVDSARIAALKAAEAQLDVRGCVMASDAFFPFRDGLDSAARAGVTAVIQPGGSRRDEEVIASANEHGMAMVFTGMRHFRH